LVQLLNEDNIYKESGISLDLLSERLGTSRHNTSQVINEHFDMNFYELMNKYRIDEAIQLIKNEKDSNLNIIDIAYKVGFNNKVTFNKSFKKALSVTPSQYIKSIKSEE
jgi:AraC-like DNA-binding protein